MNTLDYEQREHDIEVMSWAIASLLLPYHRNLKVSILHPGGGLYDVLSVRSTRPQRGEFIELNRNGSIHLPDDRLWWPAQPHWAEDVVRVIVKLTRLQQQPGPQNRPAIHIARLIAAALTQLGPGAQCRAGFIDSSGAFDASGMDRALFEHFPGAQQRVAIPPVNPSQFFDAAYRFFFLTQGHPGSSDFRPRLALEMTGYAWLPGRREPIATPADWPSCSKLVLELLTQADA